MGRGYLRAALKFVFRVPAAPCDTPVTLSGHEVNEDSHFLATPLVIRPDFHTETIKNLCP